jgi:hypothetical protein
MVLRSIPSVGVAHHDICIIDEAGKVLAKRQVPEALEGVSQLHALVAAHAKDPSEVVIGIETDRGLFVQALVAAGCQVDAINPFAASRYRDRQATSGAQVRPRRRQGAGRAGAHRPPEPPAGSPATRSWPRR